MKHHQALALIRETGIIVVMRARSSDQLLAAAGAIREGGARVIEVTMTTPAALSIIEAAVSAHCHEVLFGAGTVLDGETARAAILAGAQFIVAPSLNTEVIRLCRRYSVPVIPGAFTPTEILTAWECGADMVKVFPASLGGAELIKALKAPLPQVELVAVGGVDLDTTAGFIRAGATAVGVGSALVNQKILDERDFTSLTARTGEFMQEVARGRGE